MALAAKYDFAREISAESAENSRFRAGSYYFLLPNGGELVEEAHPLYRRIKVGLRVYVDGLAVYVDVKVIAGGDGKCSDLLGRNTVLNALAVQSTLEPKLIPVYVDLTLTGLGLLKDLAQGVAHGVAKLPELDEAHPAAQVYAGTHQQQEHPGSPGDAVELANDFFDRHFQSTLFLLLKIYEPIIADFSTKNKCIFVFMHFCPFSTKSHGHSSIRWAQ